MTLPPPPHPSPPAISPPSSSFLLLQFLLLSYPFLVEEEGNPLQPFHLAGTVEVSHLGFAKLSCCCCCCCCRRRRISAGGKELLLHDPPKQIGDGGGVSPAPALPKLSSHTSTQQTGPNRVSFFLPFCLGRPRNPWSPWSPRPSCKYRKSRQSLFIPLPSSFERTIKLLCIS